MGFQAYFYLNRLSLHDFLNITQKQSQILGWPSYITLINMMFIIQSKNQTIMNKVLFLICLISIFISNSCSNALPFTSNKALFLNERFNVDIYGTNAALKSNVWGTSAANFTINYPNYFVADSVFPNMYLGDFEFSKIENGISCIMQPVNLTDTGFVFNVKTSNSSNIARLSINYILIYSLKNYAGKFYIKGNLITVNRNISKDVKTFYNTYATLPANYSTDDIVIRSFFSGFEIKPTSNTGDLDLSIASRIYNSTSYQIVISSSSSQPTNVQLIRALFVIISKTFMETNQEEFGYRFFSGSAKSSSKKTELSFKEDHQPMSFNTIVGLSGFSLQKQSTLGFSSSIDASIIKVTSASPITSFSVNYIVVQSTYCGYNSPYLDSSTKSCYQECPGSTVSNDEYLSCDCYIDGFYENDSSKCINQSVRLLQIQTEQNTPSNPIKKMLQEYLH